MLGESRLYDAIKNRARESIREENHLGYLYQYICDIYKVYIQIIGKNGQPSEDKNVIPEYLAKYSGPVTDLMLYHIF